MRIRAKFRRLLCKAFIIVQILILRYEFAPAQETMLIDEYLKRVEESLPSLKSASFEPELAEAEIRNALGRFDPVLNAAYTYKSYGDADKINLLKGSVDQPLDMLFGPTLSATYMRGIGTNIDPQNATSLPGETALGLTLPLFQGIFTDPRRNSLRKAMVLPEMADAQFRMERNNALRAAAGKYLDWVEKYAISETTDSILQLAERRIEMISKRIIAGESKAIDSIEILQEVLKRRSDKLNALRGAEQAAVDASVFLWNRDGTPMLSAFKPQNLILFNMLYETPSDPVTIANSSRPELKRIQSIQSISRLDSSLAIEFLRPFVQADAMLISSNLASLSALNYKVGIKISQPLLFRSASAQSEIADVAVKRADLTVKMVERQIDADVRNATIALSRAKQRFDILLQEVATARIMVAAEQRKFLMGDSNLLNVNLRERFLLDAQLRQISAVVEVQRAIYTMKWALGQI